MTLHTEIEIWNKYGAYLIGVTGISAKHKGVSFETFYNNLDGSTGGWSREALKNAWNVGQK